ncbi:Inositol-tetrakisphosphate 1-kinase 3 [Linum grandiflorum]
MGLQEEIVPLQNVAVGATYDEHQVEEPVIDVSPLGIAIPLQRKFVVVGYALTSKKIKSFLQPKLERLARNKGILFVAIDQSKPLSDQGPFDIVLHKLTGREWRQILEDYRRSHPEVTVLDPPDAIQHLHNRQSMLQCVADMNLCSSYGKVDVPRQLVIKKDASSIPDAVAKAGLMLPIVAKPLVADGSAKSHELSLAYDQYSLRKLEPPLVLQEFINHELPPRLLLEKLGKELRRRLGLRLFNLDIIREHGTRDQFYVIDINYFPGYGKVPEYEHIFTDFLLGLAESKYKKKSYP